MRGLYLPLAINRSHPDFRGLSFCVPGDRRTGSNVVPRVLFATGGSPSSLALTGGPTAGSAVLRSGPAIVLVTAGNEASFSASVSAAPWTAGGGVSAMWRMRVGTLGRTDCVFQYAGFVAGPSSGSQLFCGNDATSTTGGSGATLVTGVEYVCGIRYVSGACAFFLNGVKTTNAETFPTPTASKVGIGNGTTASTSFRGAVRDLRIWNRQLPDSAFERYYVNPDAFYMWPRRSVAGLPFNGGMFMPFLHPSLQS